LRQVARGVAVQGKEWLKGGCERKREWTGRQQPHVKRREGRDRHQGSCDSLPAIRSEAVLTARSATGGKEVNHSEEKRYEE
jgi:hypothetical protein